MFDPKAHEKMAQWIEKPSSTIFESSHTKVLDLLHAESEKLVYTSNVSEAKCQVLFSMLRHSLEQKRYHWIISTEDEAMRKCALFLRGFGIEVSWIVPNESGYIDEDVLIDLIQPQTLFCSIPHVDPLTGVIHPIEQLYAVCQEREILLHVDYTHTTFFKPLNFEQAACDFITFDPEAFTQLEAFGLLYAKKEIFPFIFGEPYQKARAGSIDRMKVVGLGEYLEYFTSKLTAYLAKGPDFKSKLSGLELFKTPHPTAPHIVPCVFEHVHAQMLAFALQQEDLHVAVDLFEKNTVTEHLQKMGLHLQGLTFWFNPLAEDRVIQSFLGAFERIYANSRRYYDVTS